MYSIVLVEDETIVREGIIKKILWQEYGFVLAGAYENGAQAAQALEREQSDVVITDINMPVMDGLELARRINQSAPDTIVVILTGYGDFTYAQTAIKYRVYEYILKPVTARQLCELLDRLRVELNGRRAGRLLQMEERRENNLFVQDQSERARQAQLAVNYIKEHFCDPQLSLQRITAHLSVSTSYFSSIFKSHTGITFVDFLTRLRLNKARELLTATDLKNYEIAAEVGYDDPGYFSNIFKKNTGFSPSDYRRRYRKR